MELEVKHLAPYLPYELKLIYETTNSIGKVMKMQTGIMRSISHNENETHPTRVGIDFHTEEHIWMFKPILRPLSDLDKQVEMNGFFGFNPAKRFELSKDEDGRWCDEFSASQCESPIAKVDLSHFNFWLFEYHFDVFGLIEKGLAIDINTLSVNGS